MAFAKPVIKYRPALLTYSLFFLALLFVTPLKAGFPSGTPAGQDTCAFEMEGRVLDLETKEPIPFVTVRIQDNAIGTITDEHGNFEITGLCDREFNITVSHVGYKTATHHHDVYHESPTILLASQDQLLHSIIIEGEYNPTNINTILIDRLSHSEFAAGRTGSLGDLAGSLLGVSVLATGQNIVKPIIHGLHSNRVLIINNGVRHEFQNWGAEHAPEIDPSLAESLEVVKGAATVRYGPDALGGVLLINPPKLELSSGFNAALSLAGKSNGRSADGDITLQHGWKNWVVSGQASLVRQGDLKAPEYLLTNTGKHEYSYSGAFRFHHKRFDLEGYFSRFYQNLGILRGSVTNNLTDLENAIENDVPQYTRPFSYDINKPRHEVTHDLMKLKGSYILDDQDFTFQYAYQINHRREFDVRRGTDNDIPNINLELHSHSLDLDWNHPEVGRLSGIIGIQSQYQDNNNIPGTNTPHFIPNYNNYRAGLFVIESLKAGQTIYEAGLRYDYQATSIRGRKSDQGIFRDDFIFSQFTTSFGLKHEITNALAFRSNFGTAWRPPNVAELYSYGKSGPFFEYGLMRYSFDQENKLATLEVLREDESPIKSELGFKWINTMEFNTEELQWEITGYMNLIRNYIYNKPLGITNSVSGPFPYFIYDQDNALFWGVDLAIKRKVSEFVEMDGRGSYVWAKDITNDDTFVGIPPARVDYNFSYTRKPDFLSSSSVGVDLSYTFRYFQEPRVVPMRRIIESAENGENLFADNHSNFDFTSAPDGYFMTNIFWRAGKGPWEWSFQINNLFDTNYRIYTDRLRYFADQTGRNFQLTITYSIR